MKTTLQKVYIIEIHTAKLRLKTYFMTQENEKSILVHWYYSIAEWEEFIKKEKTRKEIYILADSILVGLAGAALIYLLFDMSWILSVATCSVIAVAYGVSMSCARFLKIKWKGSKVPEIVIANGTATVNGKPTVFHGDGKCLRKVDVKENNSINILEITFEKQTRKGTSFDEIRIPVPRGKLREAMELQDCLNLRREILTLFN
jgi:hypothetical protein